VVDGKFCDGDLTLPLIMGPLKTPDGQFLMEPPEWYRMDVSKERFNLSCKVLVLDDEGRRCAAGTISEMLVQAGEDKGPQEGVAQGLIGTATITDTAGLNK